MFFLVMRVILWFATGISPEFGMGFFVGALCMLIVWRINEKPQSRLDDPEWLD